MPQADFMVSATCLGEQTMLHYIFLVDPYAQNVSNRLHRLIVLLSSGDLKIQRIWLFRCHSDIQIWTIHVLHMILTGISRSGFGRVLYI